jgi:hypothetical protein
MKETQKSIEATLKRLHKKLEDSRKNRDEVTGLLEKADLRRKNEPGNERKWNQILENLEFSLDEARKTVASNELDIQRAEKSLQSLKEAAQEKPTSPEASDDSSGVIVPAIPEGMAKNILQIPIEELSKLSLEDITRLHEQMENEDQSKDLGDVTANSKASDTSAADDKKSNDSPSPEKGTVEQRRQLILRSAISKIQSNDLTQLTKLERQAVINCQRALSEKSNPSVRDQRLLRILDACLAVLSRGNRQNK